MRIGHLTLLHGYNYGGLLQAYATQKILKSHEHEVITLDYHPAMRMRLIRQLTLNIPTFHKPIGVWLDKQKFSSVPQFESFRRENFIFSPSCYSSKQLSQLCREMNAIVVGSDQVWSADWIKPPYFIDFELKRNCKRLALSACCGHSNDDTEYLNYCASTLSKFDAISVRNAFTAELVEKTTGKRPKIICDPTLATDLPTESLSDITTPYILLYVINRPRNLTLAQQVIDFWKKTNSDKIPIYSITPAELKGQETLTVDRAIYDISPFQWHYLIANANLVITDSFHGTIFSLKNHRNFAILNNNLKTASRFKSLLRDVDLEERIINGENEIYKIQNSLESNWAIVDYTIVKMSQAYHEFVANELTNSNKVN
jgi:hypothetical protein